MRCALWPRGGFASCHYSSSIVARIWSWKPKAQDCQSLSMFFFAHSCCRFNRLYGFTQIFGRTAVTLRYDERTRCRGVHSASTRSDDRNEDAEARLLLPGVVPSVG